MSKMVLNGTEIDFVVSATFPIKGNPYTVTFADAGDVEIKNAVQVKWNLTPELSIIGYKIAGTNKCLHSVTLNKKVIFTKVTAQGLYQIALGSVSSSNKLYVDAMVKAGLRKGNSSAGKKNTVITEVGALG